MTLDSIQTEFFLQQQLSDSRYSISKGEGVIFNSENCMLSLLYKMGQLANI